LVGWHLTLTFPNFTVGNALIIFEKHQVSDLLIDSWVINQGQCFFAVAVRNRLRTLHGFRDNISWKFQFFRTISLFNNGNYVAFILDPDWLIRRLFNLGILQHRKYACYFISPVKNQPESYLLGSVGFRLMLFTVTKRVMHSCEQVLTWPCVVPQEDFILVDFGVRFGLPVP